MLKSRGDPAINLLIWPLPQNMWHTYTMSAYKSKASAIISCQVIFDDNLLATQTTHKDKTVYSLLSGVIKVIYVFSYVSLLPYIFYCTFCSLCHYMYRFPAKVSKMPPYWCNFLPDGKIWCTWKPRNRR